MLKHHCDPWDLHDDQVDFVNCWHKARAQIISSRKVNQTFDPTPRQSLDSRYRFGLQPNFRSIHPRHVYILETKNSPKIKHFPIFFCKHLDRPPKKKLVGFSASVAQVRAFHIPSKEEWTLVVVCHRLHYVRELLGFVEASGERVDALGVRGRLTVPQTEAWSVFLRTHSCCFVLESKALRSMVSSDFWLWFQK